MLTTLFLIWIVGWVLYLIVEFFILVKEYKESSIPAECVIPDAIDEWYIEGILLGLIWPITVPTMIIYEIFYKLL